MKITNHKNVSVTDFLFNPSSENLFEIQDVLSLRFFL